MVFFAYNQYRQSQTAKKQAQAYNKAIATAEAAGNDSGNYVKSYQELQSTIGLAQTKAQKIKLYHDLAFSAYSSGHIAEAISYFSTLDSLDPSSVGMNADIFGQCYQRTGDKTNALKQYKLALAYYQQPAQAQYAATNDTVSHIQSEIQSVGGQ